MNSPIMRCCLSLISCLALLACGNGQGNVEVNNKRADAETEKNTQVTMGIHLYRYDDFSVAKAEYLKAELQIVYPVVVLESVPIKLPQEYYHSPRNRYSGNGLLRDLSKYRKGTVVLGLTDEVIYQANEKSPTWGIFGVSPVGAYVALISITQPSGRIHTDDHLVKLMMHELGHSFGLNHCKDEHCFMVDAEHGNKFSQTPSFCKNCKAFLEGKGWKLE